MKLKFFSHSSFQITTDSGQVLLIDPFLDAPPASPVSSDDFTMGIDDAVIAMELTRPITAIPTQYNSFPLKKGDSTEFANLVSLTHIERIDAKIIVKKIRQPNTATILTAGQKTQQSEVNH